MNVLHRVRTHPRVSGAIGVAVLVAAGVGVYVGTRGDSASAATSTTVATVSTGTIRQSVSATGTLAPAKEEELNFGVSGTVTSVDVTEGQHVVKGQQLATVDSASLESTVAQAKASVASAKAKVDSDESSGASDTQTNADKAALKAARNQLASARSQLAAATMTSPITGLVATVNLTVGQSVSGSSASSGSSGSSGGTGGGAVSGLGASSSSTSSSAQILVISEKSWIVNATVDATSVGLIKAGEQAQLTVTGASSTVYGTIGSIGLVSSSSSGSASYPVVIDVTGSPSGLHDGASVTATLIYRQLSGVLVVSMAALHRTSNGSYVEKVVGSKTVKTTVTTGLSSGGQVQIKSGLRAGDKIVVPQLNIGRLGSGSGSGSGGRTGTGTQGGFPGGGGFPAGGFPAGGFPGGGNGGN